MDRDFEARAQYRREHAKARVIRPGDGQSEDWPEYILDVPLAERFAFGWELSATTWGLAFGEDAVEAAIGLSRSVAVVRRG